MTRVGKSNHTRTVSRESGVPAPFLSPPPGTPGYQQAARPCCRLVVFGGGIPLVGSGVVVGAVGVSGGTPGQDVQVTEAGLSAFKKYYFLYFSKTLATLAFQTSSVTPK
ncbi:MAG: heme-binding protein [Vulcanimicrobiota bacterium]